MAYSTANYSPSHLMKYIESWVTLGRHLEAAGGTLPEAAGDRLPEAAGGTLPEAAGGRAVGGTPPAEGERKHLVVHPVGGSLVAVQSLQNRKLGKGGREQCH